MLARSARRTGAPVKSSVSFHLATRAGNSVRQLGHGELLRAHLMPSKTGFPRRQVPCLVAQPGREPPVIGIVRP